MERIPIANIKRRPGRECMANWKGIADELQAASVDNEGIVLRVPEEVDGENFRHAAQIMLKSITGHKVGVSINQRRQHEIVSFNVWLKEAVDAKD